MLRKKRILLTVFIGSLTLLFIIVPASMAKDTRIPPKNDETSLARITTSTVEIVEDSFFFNLWQLLNGNSNHDVRTNYLNSKDNPGHGSSPYKPCGGENGCIMMTDKP